MWSFSFSFLSNRKARRVSRSLLHCSCWMALIKGNGDLPKAAFVGSRARARRLPLSSLPATCFMACHANLRKRVSQHKSFCLASKSFRKKAGGGRLYFLDLVSLLALLSPKPSLPFSCWVNRGSFACTNTPGLLNRDEQRLRGGC